MKTLYRLSILAALAAIILLLWRILHKEAVTPVTNVTPHVYKSEFVQSEEAQFAERMLRRAKDNRDASSERQANKRLGVN